MIKLRFFDTFEESRSKFKLKETYIIGRSYIYITIGICILMNIDTTYRHPMKLKHGQNFCRFFDLMDNVRYWYTC